MCKTRKAAMLKLAGSRRIEAEILLRTSDRSTPAPRSSSTIVAACVWRADRRSGRGASMPRAGDREGVASVLRPGISVGSCAARATTCSPWARDIGGDLCSSAAARRGAAWDAGVGSCSCGGRALDSPDSRVDDPDPRKGRLNEPSRPCRSRLPAAPLAPESGLRGGVALRVGSYEGEFDGFPLTILGIAH